MNNPQAILIVDLAFGDCGKGTIIDFLTRTRDAHTVVRFNGGPQAGHNVVTPQGQHHTFSQFGSGTFIPGVRTVLSRFMLIEPYALFNEAEHLVQLGVGDPLARLLIDGRCPVITPAHQAANRLHEIARGDRAHGTCGLGVGEAMQDLLDHPDVMIHAVDLGERATVIRKLRAVRDLKVEQLRPLLASTDSHPLAQVAVSTLLDASWIEVAADNYAELSRRATIGDPSSIAAALGAPGTILFEGAQGVLLDETFGFHPHTTWSTTTFANADALLDEAAYAGRRTRIGVLRCYFTRHGPGPFVTDDPSLKAELPEPHNADTGWQGRFRVGPFDAVAARYALAVAGPVDALAITHLDRLRQLPPRICTAYEDPSPQDLFPATPINDGLIRENGRIVAIAPQHPDNGLPAERRTGSLNRCRPIYQSARTGTEGAFIEMIEAELRTTIGIRSYGMTSAEKKDVNPSKKTA